jgi:hypothetical protein
LPIARPELPAAKAARTAAGFKAQSLQVWGISHR